MEIKSEDLEERKPLTEDCWIDLGDGFEIRIDYPTRGQESEYKRVSQLMGVESRDENKFSDEQLMRLGSFYLKCVCKEIKGLNVDKEPAKLEIKKGLAENIVFKKDGKEKSVDFIDWLSGMNLWLITWAQARMKLKYDDVDKKKLQLQPNSTEKENSQEEANTSVKA
jgi:hypothetical protein